MEINQENVKRTIEQYLNAEIKNPKDNFFDLGILDSFETINLILVLEETFAVKIEALDFADNKQFNLERIHCYLEQKKV